MAEQPGANATFVQVEWSGYEPFLKITGVSP